METRHLTFSYSWSEAAAGNGTGHDLNMSGMVDVTVLEQVENPQQF
ncbi:hypothetical protein AB1A65_01575 [Muricauda sp. ANG21]